MGCYLGNSELKAVIIGGGLYTVPHRRSGGYRLDFVNLPGMRKALYNVRYEFSAPNNDGTLYGVWITQEKFLGHPLRFFYVHIKNPRREKIKRGQVLFDFTDKYIHLHIIWGNKYLKYLQYLDPRIRITTNYGSNAYTGRNKGECLPGIRKDKMVKIKTGKSKPYLLPIISYGQKVFSKPYKNSSVKGRLNAGDKRTPNAVITGQEVDGNNVWFYLWQDKGYISARYVRPYSRTAELIEKIKSILNIK